MSLRICLFFMCLSFISHSANAQADFLFPHDTAAVFYNLEENRFFTAFIQTTIDDECGAQQYFKGDFLPEGSYEMCWETFCDAGNNNPGEFGTVYRANNDTTHVFVNMQGDSLVFNFNLMIGESSLFCDESTAYFITRLANGYTNEWVLGETVYNFEITAMMDYEEITTPFSGQVISIGTETGLHKFFDIQEFPLDFNPVELRGNTIIDAGIVPFTFSQAHDFQLAEVYQYLRIVNTPGSHSSSLDTYTIMSREDGEGSVMYQIQKESVTTVYMSNYEDIIPPEIIFSEPTNMATTYFNEQIAPNLYGPRYPAQGVSGYGILTQEDLYGEERMQLTVGLDQGYSACDDDPDCFFTTWIPSYQYKRYIPGLGRVYEYFGDGSYGWTEELVYFEKDGITWGGDATSVEAYGLETLILQAFPNPSTGKFTLNKSVQNARLYNSMGQLVAYVTGTEVDITAFAEGLYILKALENNGTAVRIIKQ
jgi:hypothetical protein